MSVMTIEAVVGLGAVSTQHRFTLLWSTTQSRARGLWPSQGKGDNGLLLRHRHTPASAALRKSQDPTCIFGGWLLTFPASLFQVYQR